MRGCAVRAAEALGQGRCVEMGALQAAGLQRQREVPAPEQGAKPRRRLHGVAVRGRVLEGGVTHALEVAQHLGAAVGAGVNTAQR